MIFVIIKINFDSFIMEVVIMDLDSVIIEVLIIIMIASFILERNYLLSHPFVVNNCFIINLDLHLFVTLEEVGILNFMVIIMVFNLVMQPIIAMVFNLVMQPIITRSAEDLLNFLVEKKNQNQKSFSIFGI